MYELGRVRACDVCPAERIRVHNVIIFTGFGQVITRRNGLQRTPESAVELAYIENA